MSRFILQNKMNIIHITGNNFCNEAMIYKVECTSKYIIRILKRTLALQTKGHKGEKIVPVLKNNGITVARYM